MRRNNRSVLLYLLFTVALVMTGGCNRKTIYHHYEHTPLAGWEKNDTLVYQLPAAKERAVVQRDVELRVSADYPFRSLHLIVEQIIYPSRHTRLDTLECELVTPEGEMLGNGVSLYQYWFRLPDISLNEGDSLCIGIRHDMKREILPGIADVGLHLTAY